MKQASSTASKFLVVARIEDIPELGSEAEEHAFWATHELSDALWDQAEPLALDELPGPRLKTMLAPDHGEV